MRHIEFFLTRKKKSFKAKEKKLCKYSQAWGGQSSEEGWLCKNTHERKEGWKKVYRPLFG